MAAFSCVKKLNHPFRLATLNSEGRKIMTLKEKFREFERLAPKKDMSIMDHTFTYRYFHHDDSNRDVTIVILPGGSGLADGFFYMFDRLISKYNLLSFDYCMSFRTNESQADAICSLIRQLGCTNVYLLGQSYGDCWPRSLQKGIQKSSRVSFFQEHVD